MLILIECVCWVKKPSPRGKGDTDQATQKTAGTYAREAETHRKGKGEEGTHDALVESPHVCIPYFLFWLVVLQ